MSSRDSGALRHDGENDYAMRDGWQSAWVAVDDAVVHIVRGKNGLEVAVYVNHHEDEDSIDNLFISYEALRENAQTAKSDKRRSRDAAF